jgi:WD40 repeat protein
LIASGSNDRDIKILVTPNLDNDEDLNQLLVLVLKGHSAIVRTVCFDPSNDLVLLSGGLSDTDVKVWNSETGKNVSNLKGHSGSIYSIKMTADGSFAMSVGTDKFIRIWDVRAKSHVAAIDGTAYAEMNEIAFYQHQVLDSGAE